MYIRKTGISIIAFTAFMYCTIAAYATVNDTLPSGTYLINMGIVPQTYSNGLKPYGLIYDLTENFIVPVEWIINQTKTHNGTDFIYNSTTYKGGTFAIKANYITAEIDSVISAWNNRGVVGEYTTSAIVVPVYQTITTFPNLVIDQQSSDLITPYFDSASIPASSYRIGLPSDLTNCDDLYAMPHADPTWSTHSYLYDFVLGGGYFWASCHAVSVLESLSDAGPPLKSLNFLTSNGLQCFDPGKCGSIPESHDKTASRPYSYLSGYGSSPIMQFMGTMDSATENGSEEWYIPLSSGQWLNSTQRPVITSDGSAPNEGVKIAYGYAFGDSSYGMVMYEAGHRLTTGSGDDPVAAQRAFFNFLLLSIADKALGINANVAAQINSGNDTTFSASISGGSAPFTYQWSADCGGTFSNPNDSSTLFTPDTVWTTTQCVITLQVTDNCSRSNFDTWIININPPQILLPIGLDRIHVELEDKTSFLNWNTSVEINNDFYDIERRHENENDFYRIGTVDGGGTLINGASYSYEDDVAAMPVGKIYYRLKQVNLNGHFGYSPVVYVDLKSDLQTDLLIYPNPGQGLAVLQLSVPSEGDGDILVGLIDLQGRIVKQETYNSLLKGINQLIFKIPDVESGIYLLRIQWPDETVNKPIMVNRN